MQLDMNPLARESSQVLSSHPRDLDGDGVQVYSLLTSRRTFLCAVRNAFSFLAPRLYIRQYL